MCVVGKTYISFGVRLMCCHCGLLAIKVRQIKPSLQMSHDHFAIMPQVHICVAIASHIFRKCVTYSHSVAIMSKVTD